MHANNACGFLPVNARRKRADEKLLHVKKSHQMKKKLKGEVNVYLFIKVIRLLLLLYFIMKQ